MGITETQGSNAFPTAREETSGIDYILPADSDQEPVLSVVMPTLNEEEGIEECLTKIKRAAETLEVPTEIVVSDSSTDRTPEIAREHDAVVVVPDQPGYGYAYQYAFERARGEYIAIGDADTTYDFEELPKLFEAVALGDADMAMGSRFEGEIKDGAMPALHQYVGNPALTKFLNMFYDAGVSDAHSGMRVISRDALEQLNLQTDGMEFASEMIMEAGARDLTIAEFPITYHEREGEATLDSFEDGWRHLRFMLENAPGYLFSIPGMLLGTLGLVVMTIAFFDVSLSGVTLGPHSMIAGSLFTIVGFQVGSFGVFATVASDPIRRPNDRVTTWLTDRVRMEEGVLSGSVLALAGSVYALSLMVEWVTSGFAELPLVKADIVAMTAIVLGVQIVFSAFFMSTIASRRE